MGFIVCKTVVPSLAVSQVNEGGINIFYNIFDLPDVDISQKSRLFCRFQIKRQEFSVLCQGGENLVSPSGNQKLIQWFLHTPPTIRTGVRFRLPDRRKPLPSESGRQKADTPGPSLHSKRRLPAPAGY